MFNYNRRPSSLILLVAFVIVGFGLPFGFAATEEVNIWGWRGDSNLWEAVQEKLQKDGVDVTINYERTVATEYDSRMALGFQGGTAPDIVYTRRLPGQRTQSLIDGGFLVPLNDEMDFTNFPDITLDFIRSHDQIWGVPFANQIIGIFYNKDLYEQYSLEEPDTWDQLIENAETLQQNGVTPFFVPGRDAWILAMQHAMTGVSDPGPEWIRELQEGNVNFLDPVWIDINERLNDLKQYYQRDFMANVATDQDSAFAFGQAGMVFYGIWAFSQWKELNPDLNIGYFPVPPKDASKKPYAYAYMDGSLALNAEAQHADAAMKVLQFAASPEFGTLFAEINGEMPAVMGSQIVDDQPLLQEGLNTVETSASPYTYWVGSPFETGTPTLYDVLTSGMQEMYLGQISPEELAQQTQDRVSTWYEPLQ